MPNRAAIGESIVLAGWPRAATSKHSMFYRRTYMYPIWRRTTGATQGPIAFCMRGPPSTWTAGPPERYRPGRLALGREPRQHHAHRGRLHRACGHHAHAAWRRTRGRWLHLGGGERSHRRGPPARCGLQPRRRRSYRKLVTEPDRTPEEAPVHHRSCARSTWPGISDCSMEEGSLLAAARRVGCAAAGPPSSAPRPSSRTRNSSSRTCTTGWPTRSAARRGVLGRAASSTRKRGHWDPSAKRTIVMRVKGDG